jgi:mRNA interferase MazF
MSCWCASRTHQARGKKRPAVVIQADSYANTIPTVVVAEVTSNLSMATDPACLLIDVSTPDGQVTGLVKDSVVSALVLVTVYADAVDQTLGRLSPALLAKLDGCIQTALGLP